MEIILFYPFVQLNFSFLHFHFHSDVVTIAFFLLCIMNFTVPWTSLILIYMASLCKNTWLFIPIWKKNEKKGIANTWGIFHSNASSFLLYEICENFPPAISSLTNILAAYLQSCRCCSCLFYSTRCDRYLSLCERNRGTTMFNLNSYFDAKINIASDSLTWFLVFLLKIHLRNKNA